MFTKLKTKTNIVDKNWKQKELNVAFGVVHQIYYKYDKKTYLINTNLMSRVPLRILN